MTQADSTRSRTGERGDEDLCAAYATSHGASRHFQMALDRRVFLGELLTV